MTTGESMVASRPDTRLDFGQGIIGPEPRVNAGEITNKEVRQFVEALYSDEFDAEAASLIPTKCVDGRFRADDVNSLGANAAGGTFSVVMGDALTTGRYLHDGDNAAAHAKTVYGELVKMGHAIGVHDDEHAAGDNCGCGAEDKLDNAAADAPSILRFIAQSGDKIKDLVESLGVTVTDQTHSLITSNAERLHEGAYAATGKELRQAAVDEGGKEAVETLAGKHNEVALRIELRPGKTLDRGKLAAKYGGGLRAFNLDVPSLQEAARITSLTGEEAHQKLVAMLYYNVATAAVLAGSSLHIVVKG